jgi:cytochrome c-type biogenesis protein CcmH/NrfG
MKKRFLILSLLVFVAVSAFVIIKKQGKNVTGKLDSYTLLPRNSALAYAAEWATVANNARVLEQKIKANPADIKSSITLAALYIQEGRVTGNFTYYNEAALKLINSVLKNESSNFEALTFKATILLSQHQFQEAKKIAEEILKTYPHNAYVYGLLVDANIE